jgi:hypothetical protein
MVIHSKAPRNPVDIAFEALRLKAILMPGKNTKTQCQDLRLRPSAPIPGVQFRSHCQQMPSRKTCTN